MEIASKKDKGPIPTPSSVKRFIESIAHRGILVALDVYSNTINLRRKKVNSVSDDWGELELSYESIVELSNTRDVDSWARYAFKEAFPELASMFFEAFVTKHDSEKELIDRWGRFLMVRGFISPFHPGKGVFGKSFSRRFIMDHSVALDASCGHIDNSLPEGSFRIRVFPDGNAWSAAFEPFVDMVQTPTKFGDTPAEAILKLVTNHVFSATRRNSSP